MAPSSTLVFDLLPRNDSSAPIDCTTDFSNDYYGLGVRLGVYFAWLGSYFANTLLPGEISGTLDTNTIFLLALLISLFTGTHMHNLYQVDALIVLTLSSGFLFSCFSIWGYRTLHYQNEGAKGIRHFGGMGTHCRLALIFAICVYGAWFWSEGVKDELKIASDPQCMQVYIWFFATWRVGGGINIFYTVLTVCCSIYYGAMLIAAAVAVVYKPLSSGFKKWKEKMKFETGLNNKELKIIYNVQRVFNIAWIVFCANQVEMTLNQNHLLGTLAQHSDVRPPAQLLPLLIGVLSFARTLWLIFDEHGKTIAKILRTEAENAKILRAEAENEPPKILHNIRRGFEITVRRIISPLSVSSSTVSTDGSEQSQSHMPHGFHPWHQRYLVAWMPWLSIFKFWRRSCPVPETLPTMADDTPKEDQKLDVTVYENSA